MVLKTFILCLVLQLVAASLKKGSEVAAAERHQRTIIPAAQVLPERAASAKGLHLSVTTGTPGVWYPGKKTHMF